MERELWKVVHRALKTVAGRFDQKYVTFQPWRIAAVGGPARPPRVLGVRPTEREHHATQSRVTRWVCGKLIINAARIIRNQQDL